ncbi:MAG: hypothetical protein ABJ242_10180 [Marinomonas sp.]
MSNLKKQLALDKALRDEARALIDADIAHAKTLVAPDNMRERTVPLASEKAQSLLSGTRASALDNKGTIAAVAGAAISAGILWIVREPLMELFGQLTASGEQDEARSNGSINSPEDAENTP